MSRDASWWLLPEVVREVAEVVGLTLALRLAGNVFASGVGTRSGRFGTIYVPEKPKGQSFDRLSALVGEQGAAEIVKKLAGTELRFGSCAAWSNRLRDASVRDYWRNSTLGVESVAWLHDLTERQVRNICSGEQRLARPAALRQQRAARMSQRSHGPGSADRLD